MDDTQKRNRVIFWTILILGVIGLMDFFSNGFATPIFNQTHPGLNIPEIGIVGGLLFDFFLGLHLPSFAAGSAVITIFLSDLWWLLLIGAYFVQKQIKKAKKPLVQ